MEADVEEVTNQKISQMYYHNFDLHITAKYDVTVKNWPLKIFCAPSKISLRVELNVLFEAWKSNTTRFYKITCKEFEAWETQWLECMTNNDDGSCGITLASIEALLTSTSARTLQTSTNSHINRDSTTSIPTLLSMNVVNMVSGGDGSAVFVTKKLWKVRKDKEIKRKKPTSPEAVVDNN
ncbi:hypothetical protein C0992_008053 [Termitomyces sp. T32_za158]|nr:hypothetical protein C0992_008053 [Termitomyces sp. T32_za158]